MGGHEMNQEINSDLTPDEELRREISDHEEDYPKCPNHPGVPIAECGCAPDVIPLRKLSDVRPKQEAPTCADCGGRMRLTYRGKNRIPVCPSCN